MEVVSGAPVALVLLAVEKPGVMALLRWAGTGGRPIEHLPSPSLTADSPQNDGFPRSESLGAIFR